MKGKCVFAYGEKLAKLHSGNTFYNLRCIGLRQGVFKDVVVHEVEFSG